MSRRILIVDGHAVAFQAYYGIHSELTAPDGTPTGAVVGFLRTLLGIGKQVKADQAYIAFDRGQATFRHELYPDYKANRSPMDDNLAVQMPLIFKVLDLAGFVQLSKAGLEADDLIASGAFCWSEQGHQVWIATGDKDLRQVLRPGVTLINPRKKGTSAYPVMEREDFIKEYGFEPCYMADWLALVGDTADNVPGVPGVGPKTATSLIAQYGSVRGVLDHLDDFKGKRLENLKQYGPRALDMLELTRVKLDCDLDEFVGAKPVADPQALEALLDQLGFNSRWAKNLLDLAGETFDDAPQLDRGESPLIIGPMRGAQVDLEELVHQAPLMVDFDEAQVYLTSRGGGWTKIPRGGRVELLQSLPLIFADKKAWLTAYPDGSWRGDDLTTLHYLLNPDREGHGPQALTGRDASVDRCFELWAHFDFCYEEVERLGCLSLYADIDLPLLDVLVTMERAGLPVDRAALQGVLLQLQEAVEETAAQLDALAKPYMDGASSEQLLELFATAQERKKGRIPTAVNWGSPKQVGALLYGLMGLPTGKKGKTGYSTNEAQLIKLAQNEGQGSKVAGLLLRLRELTKVQTGFCIPLIKASEADGRVHSTFDPHTAATGRLSSKNPNVQNLPGFGDWAERLKECFRAPEGWVFVGADYSQIELRLLAHQSGIPELIDIFNRGEDVHRAVAALVYGLKPEEVSPEQRRRAKMVSFGLIYGMSGWGLGDRLDIPTGEALAIKERYFDALPGVKRFMDELVRTAIRREYCRTPAGRIRPLGDVRDRAGHLERVAINTPIQGQGADIMKKAMLDLAPRLDFLGAQLVLQVHDSLVLLVPRDRVEEAEKTLARTMEAAVRLKVPLKVETKHGAKLSDL